MKTPVRLAIAMLPLVMSSAIAATAVLPAVVPAFSQMRPDGAVTGWQALKPAPKAADTQYRLVADNGKVVLMAEAKNSMSGLIHPLRVDLRQTPLLRWRWKIAGPVKSADMTKKSGDDYAARIYVMFDYPADKLSLGTRIKLQLAEKFYSQKIPTAALNYVWDNRHPVGSLQANTYTDRARMMVLQSGAEKSGQWVTETRDLAADFRLAFGEEAPDVVAVALASDTDNTGESVTAWFGDIEFLPPPKAATP